MKVPCTFRIDSEALQRIVKCAAALTISEGRKVSQAEVIERAFSVEESSAGSIGAKIQSDVQIMNRDFNRPPEVSVAKWRASRNPLPKPSQRK